MSDWVEEVDIGGDRYELKDLQTEATAQQNEQDIENIKTGANYSTQEVSTGEKWVDNKAIYKKTFTQGSSNAIDISSLNIENIINIEGLIRYQIDANNFGVYPIVSASNGFQYQTSFYIVNNQTINFYLGSYYSGAKTISITVWYTKNS